MSGVCVVAGQPNLPQSPRQSNPRPLPPCYTVPMTQLRQTQMILSTLPLRRALERLSDALCAAVSDSRACLRFARAVGAMVRLIITIEARNYAITRKSDMLAMRGWRERVARELGGEGRFKAWDRAHIAARARRGTALPKPNWLLLKQRKERARMAAIGARFRRAHPRIIHDAVRLDFEGEFRLAPIGRRSARRVDCPPPLAPPRRGGGGQFSARLQSYRLPPLGGEGLRVGGNAPFPRRKLSREIGRPSAPAKSRAGFAPICVTPRELRGNLALSAATAPRVYYQKKPRPPIIESRGQILHFSNMKPRDGPD
jgi:hypothetical protein